MKTEKIEMPSRATCKALAVYELALRLAALTEMYPRPALDAAVAWLRAAAEEGRVPDLMVRALAQAIEAGAREADDEEAPG